MFICGDDADARREWAAILGKFGWEVEDWAAPWRPGPSSPCASSGASRASSRGDWGHAFKLLRPLSRSGLDRPNRREVGGEVLRVVAVSGLAFLR